MLIHYADLSLPALPCCEKQINGLLENGAASLSRRPDVAQADPEVLPAAALLVTSGGCAQLSECRISSGGAAGSSCCCATGPGSRASLSDCTLVGGEAADEACVLALSGASVRLRGSLLQVRQQASRWVAFTPPRRRTQTNAHTLFHTLLGRKQAVIF